MRDENVKLRLEKFLKEHGYDIISKPKELSNGSLATFSKSEQRVLITNDRHFSNALKFSKEKIFSVVWLRIPQDKTQLLITAFESLLKEIKSSEFEGNLIKLFPDTFEIIPIPSEA
ncbi:MAG: DUF5615 family PIN-like protein [Nanoarchaeota archaeon]